MNLFYDYEEHPAYHDLGFEHWKYDGKLDGKTALRGSLCDYVAGGESLDVRSEV